MEETFGEKLKFWLITTGISLALFLIGLYGQIGVSATPTMKISNERIQLNSDLPKLAAKSFEDLGTGSLLSPETREAASQLESEVGKLKASLSQIPKAIRVGPTVSKPPIKLTKPKSI